MNGKSHIGDAFDLVARAWGVQPRTVNDNGRLKEAACAEKTKHAHTNPLVCVQDGRVCLVSFGFHEAQMIE